MTRKKVLVVEDDRDLRHGLTLRLVALGYDVVQAEDGYFAVSVARNELPDVVLLDIGLPAGDGISVLERYARLPMLSGTPVVVLTGRDPIVTERAVRRFNVSAFLTKPADNKDLATALATALATTLDTAVAEPGDLARGASGGAANGLSA
jgi:DNA-binding response OmpR family regulator